MSQTDRYHVYGIGNALVDIDVELGDETLSKLNIIKGRMTLIDENRHHSLMNTVEKNSPVLCCGGSAANTLIALSQFGGQGFYSCRVADDEVGHFFCDELDNHGLTSSLNHTNLPSGTTGKCIVMVTPDADRTMNTFLGISESLSKSDIDEGALARSEYLYIEGYLVTSDSAREAIIHAKKIAEQNDVKVSITLSDPNIAEFFRTELLDVIGDGVDLIFCNEQEALLIAQTDSLNDAQTFLRSRAHQYVVTQGANGSFIFDGQTTTPVPVFPIDAIDTVGAGDMYAGAFLYGVTHGYSPVTAGTIASMASAYVVNQIGPRLSYDRAQELLQAVHDYLSIGAA